MNLRAVMKLKMRASGFSGIMASSHIWRTGCDVGFLESAGELLLRLSRP